MKLIKSDDAEKLKGLQINKSPFLVDSKDHIKRNSIFNIKVILEMDSLLKGMFRYNEYTECVEVVKDCPELHIAKGFVRDGYVDSIACYIESSAKYQHVLFDQLRIRTAIEQVAYNNGYNPLKIYMEEAAEKWDGKDRLTTVFCDFLGAERREEVILSTKMFFYGGVAKIFDPSVKFDFVLDLVGGQGAGKTSFWQNIAPLGYYTDQFYTFTDKDDFSVMRKVLIVNDDEMTATRKASFEELKRFVTMQQFEYREPYGRSVSQFAKKFLLVRTTNDLYYLKDKTGERRFLPILVNKDKQTMNPVEDLTPDFTQQVWGQAVVEYRKQPDFKFTFNAEQDEVIAEYRRNFMHTDELEDEIEDLIENNWKDKDFISSADIEFGLSITSLASDRKLSNRISNIMVNRFGFRKGYKKINGKSKRGYLR